MTRAFKFNVNNCLIHMRINFPNEVFPNSLSDDFNERERNEKKYILLTHRKVFDKANFHARIYVNANFHLFGFQCSWRAAQVWAMRTSSAFAMAPISKSTTFRYWWSPLRCIFEYKSMAVCYPIDLDFFDYDVHFIFIWLRSVRIGRTELSKKIAHICE